MKRSAFATLIGVSKQQVSKYETAGALAVVDGEVDAAESLALLEGRLDEVKRQRALQALAGASGARTQQQPLGKPAQSAKAQKDEIDRDLKLLEYGQKAGDLVNAEEVADRAHQAVGAMRDAFANRRRDSADRICATFGIAPEKAPALARALGQEFEEALGVFARMMAGLANAETAADQAEPAEEYREQAAISA